MLNAPNGNAYIAKRLTLACGGFFMAIHLRNISQNCNGNTLVALTGHMICSCVTWYNVMKSDISQTLRCTSGGEMKINMPKL